MATTPWYGKEIFHYNFDGNETLLNSIIDIYQVFYPKNMISIKKNVLTKQKKEC